MAITKEENALINAAVEQWRQGDFFLSDDLFFIHLADLACPLTPEATEMAAERIETGENLEVEGVASTVCGYIVITQTCDIVRDCVARSHIQLSPLVAVEATTLKETRLLRRPALAFVPGAADKNLVADLDRMITVEKSILRGQTRVIGCHNDSEHRAFADALARHRTRPAFPDDFNKCMRPVRDHLKKIHRNNDAEGLLIQSIGEIRVSASPNWDVGQVEVFVWFILLDQVAAPSSDISQYIDKWLALFETSQKYSLEAIVCSLAEIKASEYVCSDRLDLDQLSMS